MNTFRKLIAVVILLTSVFTISLSVNAFKPTVTEYGHTSITQKVIGDNGYPAGHGGNSLIGLAQFQFLDYRVRSPISHINENEKRT